MPYTYLGNAKTIMQIVTNKSRVKYVKLLLSPYYTREHLLLEVFVISVGFV